MMKQIYSNAVSVIVWLGGCDAGSFTADAVEMVLDVNCGGSQNVKSHPLDTLRGLAQIFSRPWWKRIWIVQEVVAAREVVVACGHRIFPWKFLAVLCKDILLNEFSVQSLKNTHYRNFTALDNFRKNQGSMRLCRYLQCTRDYQATDSRDKLYALLGLASDISTDDIIPDYSKPVKTVFFELVRLLATKHGNLDIISTGHFSAIKPAATKPGITPSSPSWLPAWRASQGIRALNNEELRGDNYNAGGQTGAVVDWHQFPAALVVEGMLVDRVGYFGGTVNKPAQQSLMTLRRWHYIALQAGKNNYKTTENFWRTIIAGKDHHGRFAPASFGEANFEGFLEGAQSGYPEIQYFADAVTRAVLGRRFYHQQRPHGSWAA